LTICKAIPEFLSQLHEHDEAWIISGPENARGAVADKVNLPKFSEEILKFHESGKGLFIWADNYPFLYEANCALEKLFAGAIKLIGNTPGGRILQPQPITATSQPPKQGHFARHLLTTGIVNLYEGITICYPDNIIPEMTIIGESTNNNPCFFCVERPGKGRIIVECGYTKILDKLWAKTAGTERYVRNCAVWLLGLEARIKIGAPLRGDIRIEESNTTTSTTTEEINA